MNETEIKKILLGIVNNINPSLTWRKKSRENVMFFVRTHIPVIPTHRQFNLKIVIGIASFVLILIISVPVTDTLAAQSKPGDKLYSVARFFEKAKLAIASDSQKKELIIEQLDKRVEEFEYIAQQNDTKHEQDVAEELITHTQKVIENERFTLEEKRQIAEEIKDKLVDIENSTQKESVAESVNAVNTILSQTEIKIEHKNAEVQGEKDDTGVGGLDEKESERIPQELKKVEDNSKLPL